MFQFSGIRAEPHECEWLESAQASSVGLRRTGGGTMAPHGKLRGHSILSSMEVLHPLQPTIIYSSWPFLLPILSALIDVSNLGQVLLELDKWRRGEEAKQSPLLRLTRLIGVNLLGGREAGRREGGALAPRCKDCVAVGEQTGPRHKLQGRWMKKGSFQTWTGRVSGDGSGQAMSKLWKENGVGVKNRSSLGWWTQNFFISIT